jgi:translation initiation factor eIF-2B subunit beta
VARTKWADLNQLIERVQSVGQRLTAAQPREIAVGNIVRRVLGVIRDELEEDRNDDGSALSEANSDSRPATPREMTSPRPGTLSSPFRHNTNPFGHAEMTQSSEFASRPPMVTSHASYAASTGGPLVNSMFSLLSHPYSSTASPSGTPGTQSPQLRSSPRPTPMSSIHVSPNELKGEVVDAIDELIEELEVVDTQIADYAPDHIHANEIILITGSSTTVQRFLLKAAAKRKFTVFHAESFPNNHLETHAVVAGQTLADGEDGAKDSQQKQYTKPLIGAGITVVLIPDSAVFAIMSRVNKVILGTHGVLANGGLVAASGSRTIARAAKEHHTPVVVLTGVYKLSPLYPFDFEALIEYGEAGAVLDYQCGDMVEKVDVVNPLYDYVSPELIDLYITNL